MPQAQLHVGTLDCIVSLWEKECVTLRMAVPLYLSQALGEKASSFPGTDFKRRVLPSPAHSFRTPLWLPVGHAVGQGEV